MADAFATMGKSNLTYVPYDVDNGFRDAEGNMQLPAVLADALDWSRERALVD